MQINIGKADRTIDVDVAAFTPAVMDYVIRYGLTQALNDAHSQVTKKTQPDDAKRGEEAWALAMKKLDALKAGELRAERVTSTRDPVKAIALDMALAVLAARPGVKIAKLDKAKVRAWADDYLARNPAIMEKARLQHAATMALVADSDDGIDIEALMS